MPSCEQAIVFLESFFLAAVVLTISIGAGLLHKNDTDSPSCIDVDIDFINGNTSQQTQGTPQNLKTSSGATIEARQEGLQGVVYADIDQGALCNNLAAIFCSSPYKAGSITLYNKSILGYLTVWQDRNVTISQEFNECGAVFQHKVDGGNVQVTDPDGNCNLAELYLSVDDNTKRLIATDISNAALFTFTDPTNCGLKIQC